MRIIIADDAPGIRNSLVELLKDKHEVIECETGEEALGIIEKKSIDLVITDNRMPKVTGLALIRRGKEISPSTGFVLMTAYASVDDALEAIRLGAEDYFTKPFDLSEVLHRIGRIEQLREWKVETELKEASRTTSGLIGNSPSVRNTREFISKVAADTAPILLLGPSGSGKELVARSIHDTGPRAHRPFIAVNCASLGEQLLESELFGHEKGSFTGATTTKPGKFELASGGTLLLDEVGELSPAIQARLLRVLQEKEFYRVGGVRQIHCDARVIAATNRNLKEMVRLGNFREDLFFRLNVLAFELEPLAQRAEDITLLIPFFWDRLVRERGKRVRLSPSALEDLKHYQYPGNIRELQNILERLVVLASADSTVESEALPPEVRGAKASHFTTAKEAVKSEETRPQPEADGLKGLDDLVADYERWLVLNAMEKSKFRQVDAAVLLKITRGALQYKLKKYGYYDSGNSEPEGSDQSEAA